MARAHSHAVTFKTDAKHDDKRLSLTRFSSQVPSRLSHASKRVISSKNGDFDTKYTKGKKIGQGAFALVFKCYEKNGPNPESMEFAVKKINKNKVKLEPQNEKLFKQELEIIRGTNHANIIRIFNISEDKSYYYVVQEMMQGGDLYEYL